MSRGLQRACLEYYSRREQTALLSVCHSLAFGVIKVCELYKTVDFFKTWSHASESTVFDTVYWNQPISLAVLYRTALFFFLHSGPRILISLPRLWGIHGFQEVEPSFGFCFKDTAGQALLGSVCFFICLVSLLCPVPTWNLLLLFTYKFC